MSLGRKIVLVICLIVFVGSAGVLIDYFLNGMREQNALEGLKDLQTGRVYISSQNHGYVVDTENLDPAVAVPAFVNVNDGTNEGLAYTGKNIFTVQYHPEACPGPQDSSYLFDRFISMMEKGGKKNA